MPWSSVFVLICLAVFIGCKQGGATSASTASSSPATYGVTTDSKVEMVYLPGGQFTMGADGASSDEAPPHPVTVSAFLMDRYPVTHQQFADVQLPDPSHWQENLRTPVERVRWRDAKAYCNERSRAEKLKPCYDEKTVEWDCDYSADGYRLPTEAEWEYAARAGTQTPYEFGAGSDLRQYAWFAGNADRKTHPIGQKKPNGWGLFDMYGNVSQWCEDVYSPTYYKDSSSTDPTGPPSPGHDVKRVIRGGNWSASADACRMTYRRAERTGNTDACFATDYVGFRCVRRATADQLARLPKSQTPQ